jgi:putative thiamine transport system substrate-binding protein
VLALGNACRPADRGRLAAPAVAGPGGTQPMPTLPEPHGSWVEPVEREWLKRYGQ